MLSVLFLSLLLLSPLGLCRFSDLSGHNYDTLKVDSHRFKRDTPPSVMGENHIYYTSQYYSGEIFNEVWHDLSIGNSTSFHTQLSGGYYLYDPIGLKFRFPFYGHFLETISITTHGFLSTADILHSSIYLTQYIAPFSADFNPSISAGSRIHYLSLLDLFIVQWTDVFLETNRAAGNFTFQVQLRPSGEITFVYKTTPLTIKQTSKVSYSSLYGLADGFILNVDGSLYLYSYHNITLPDDINLTRSVYVLTPLENCITAVNADECEKISCNSSFECGWCSSISLCSDGLDRKRQLWYNSNCQNDAEIYCSVQASSVIVIVIVLVLVLIVTPLIITVMLVIVVLCVWRYRKGGSFGMGITRAAENQVSPRKSDEMVILREAEDAI